MNRNPWTYYFLRRQGCKSATKLELQESLCWTHLIKFTYSDVQKTKSGFGDWSPHACIPCFTKRKEVFIVFFFFYQFENFQLSFFDWKMPRRKRRHLDKRKRKIKICWLDPQQLEPRGCDSWMLTPLINQLDGEGFIFSVIIIVYIYQKKNLYIYYKKNRYI